jgi:hypothetical protein
MEDEMIPLLKAAARAHLSYNRMLRLVLIGDVYGIQYRGRWYVSTTALTQYLDAREAAGGPTAGALSTSQLV